MDEEENLEEQVEPVNVEVEEPGAEVQEEVQEEDNFYANLAEDLDDRVLSSLASQLISDYKKDKEYFDVALGINGDSSDDDKQEADGRSISERFRTTKW